MLLCCGARTITGHVPGEAFAEARPTAGWVTSRTDPVHCGGAVGGGWLGDGGGFAWWGGGGAEGHSFLC